MSKYKKHILFITPYIHGHAPSQRFRFEQYLSILQEEGMSFDLTPFLDGKTNHILYQKGKVLAKLAGILKGYIRRTLLMFSISKYDFVFIHRETAPLGPPVFEWIIAKVWKKKIIYDFDDAIWLSNTSETNKIAASFKWHQKVKSICQWSYKVSVGNKYLSEYASQFNPNVVINPTTIDTENLHFPKSKTKNQVPIIGWTGTHSTLQYLLPIIPVLDKLQENFSFTFLIISNQSPNIQRPYFKFKYWKKETEIDDLQAMDIGIMPLKDDQWAKGKCGFKALQYMSLGIPAIVSPVGVNTEIVDHGVNGFICDTDQEWESALTKFLSDPDLALSMADASRQKVIDHYSVLSNSKNFLKLFS